MTEVETEAVAIPGVPVVDVQIVPIDSIHSNAWNPNQQDEQTYQAERESIREHGFVVPITVRPHPTLNGELVGEGGDGWSSSEWQTIDGDHRRRAAIDEGYTTVSINNIGQVTDVNAKKLTIILNETKGDADVSLLGKLLHDLSGSFDSIDTLRVGLPYSSSELDHLLAIGTTDWDKFQAESAERTASATRPSSNNQFTVFLSFDEAQREKYDACLEILAREKDDLTAENAVIDGLMLLCQKL